jgi:hypothetical protein
MSSADLPASASARGPATAAPGQRCSSARAETGTTWFDSLAESGKIQRASGTPSARAFSSEHRMSPAAWSTFQSELWSLA